jgi:hypothetical protein
MGRRLWLVTGGLVTVALAATLTTCSRPGDLTFRNESLTDVTVLMGDQKETVSAGGGFTIIHYGCTPGDVTVKFTSGQVVVVPGPVCPEQQIVVHDGKVELQPASARLSGEPVGTSMTLAAEIWGVFEPSLTRIAENPELTRAYLIAYLRADGAHATSAGQVDVICAGLAARCVQHSGGEPGDPEALLAASAIYAVFFSATFALAVGVGSAVEIAQGLRALITAQTRPFERAGTSARVSP